MVISCGVMASQAWSVLGERLEFARLIEQPGAFTNVDKAGRTEEQVRSKAREELHQLVDEGESPLDKGLQGIRSDVGLPSSQGVPVPGVDMLFGSNERRQILQRPLDSTRWSFARTRSTLDFVLAAVLASVVGFALGRLRSRRPMLEISGVLEAAILSMILVILLLSVAPKLLYTAPEGGDRMWLKPEVAPLIGFFVGLVPHEALQTVRTMLTDLFRKPPESSAKE